MLSDKTMRIVVCGVMCLMYFSGCAQITGLFMDKPFSQKAKAEFDEENKDNIPLKESGYRVLYINSKMFRYHDYATYSINKKQEVVLELFAAGKMIGTIEILDKKICILNDCMKKWSAARGFFGKVSYGDLFNDIFFGRDIFKGVGKQIEPSKNPNNPNEMTVIQRFQKNGEWFYYRYNSEHILFKNLTNGVVISLEKYIEPKIPLDEQ